MMREEMRMEEREAAAPEDERERKKHPRKQEDARLRQLLLQLVFPLLLSSRLRISCRIGKLCGK